MSRNDQVSRQWYLLQRLESRKGATIQELAAALPEHFACHPRTIRRDLEALESRFPLVTETSGGITRWRLMDGFQQLLPLSFSTTELMALIFSRDLLKPLDGTEFKTSLDSAINYPAASGQGIRRAPTGVLHAAFDMPSLDSSHSCHSYLHSHAFLPCSQNTRPSKTLLPIADASPADTV